jgi:hypothetical protein
VDFILELVFNQKKSRSNCPQGQVISSSIVPKWAQPELRSALLLLDQPDMELHSEDDFSGIKFALAMLIFWLCILTMFFLAQ